MISQHQAIRDRNDRPVPPPCSRWVLLPSSQPVNASISARRVISGRCWVVEDPHVLHRHLVLPALVTPFLTSFESHTPQRGEFPGPGTIHASRACTWPLHAATPGAISNPVHTFLPLTRIRRRGSIAAARLARAGDRSATGGSRHAWLGTPLGRHGFVCRLLDRVIQASCGRPRVGRVRNASRSRHARRRRSGLSVEASSRTTTRCSTGKTDIAREIAN